jgi:hypothetical protein
MSKQKISTNQGNADLKKKDHDGAGPQGKNSTSLYGQLAPPHIEKTKKRMNHIFF